MDSETYQENKRIPRLKGGTDYYTWRIYIWDLMHSLQSLFVLSEPRPNEGSAAARKRWDDADRKARSAIVQNLDTQPIVTVSELIEREHCSALEVWNKLESTYKKDNIQSKLNLRQKLSTLTFKDGDDVQRHLLELETTYLELARLGDPLTEKEQTATLLRTLPDSLMAITLLANATNMEYDQVVSLVRSEMDRRVHRASTYTTKTTEAKKDSIHPYPAAKKTTTRRKQHAKGNKKGVVGWNCGRIGHIRAKCWRKKNKNKQQPNNKNSNNNKHKKGEGRNTNRAWDSNNFTDAHNQGRPNANRHHGDRNRNHYRGFIALANASLHQDKKPPTWLDSRASHVCIKDKSLFWEYHQTTPQTVNTCDHQSEIVGCGKIKLPLGTGLMLPAKHTPTFDSNLVSLSILVNYVEVQYSNGFVIKDRKTGQVIQNSTPKDGLYPIPSPVSPPQVQAATNAPGNRAMDWHEKLGHPGREKLLTCIDLCKGVPKLSLDEVNNVICTPCIDASTQRAPLRQSHSVVQRPLELTHTDLTGPITLTSLQGSNYMQVLIDDNTRASSIYFLSKKEQFFKSVRWYKARAETELPPNLMYRVRLDGAGENRSDDFVSYAMENGIVLEFTPPYAHQSNGVAEKVIQDLWKMARTFLFASKLPHELWEEAISHANYLRNRLPKHRAGMKVPSTLWFGRKLDFTNLRTFGQEGHAFIYRPETVANKKFLPRAIPGHFVGMQSPRTLCRIYIPSMGKVIKYREADFKVTKDSLPSIKDLMDFSSLRRYEAEKIMGEDDEDHLDASLAHCLIAHSRSKDLGDDGRVPESFEEARMMPGWAEAIDREYDALVERGTWKLNDTEPGMKPLPFLWRFLAKLLSSDPPRILPKARCVARGDLQRQYLDYDPDNLYAPVAHLETIRLLLAKAAAQSLILDTMHISNAYLYGDLNEPLIMKQPQNASGSSFVPGKVCLLLKSIYGAKQARQIWGSLMHNELLRLGFKQSSTDSRLYIYKSNSGTLAIVVVVDYLLTSCNSQSLLKDFKTEMQNLLKVKVLGEAKRFAGFDITRDKNGIKVQQSSHIDKIRLENGLANSNVVRTPLPSQCDITARREDERRIPSGVHDRYRKLVGRLMYLAVSSRPDIMFAASMLARKVHGPCMRHLGHAKRVLRYLKGTKGLCLFFPANNTAPMEAYCDSDWAGCREMRKSTTGLLIKVNEAPVMWTTKKQTLVALSSGDAEYIALSYCGKTLTWLRRIFWELRNELVLEDEPQMYPISIATDSSTALSIVKSPKVSERNKHIALKHHYIKELLETKIIDVKSIRTDVQAADIFTKPVVFDNFRRLTLLCALTK